MIDEKGLEAARCAYQCNRGHEVCLEAAITAYLAQVNAQPVAVKPLEWRVFCSNSGNCAASTKFGDYVIQSELGGWRLYLPHKDTGVIYPTVEAAKAAAQAEYEARIRSALVAEPAPQPADERSKIARLERENTRLTTQLTSNKNVALRNKAIAEAAERRIAELERALSLTAEEAERKCRDLRNDDYTRRGAMYANKLIRAALRNIKEVRDDKAGRAALEKGE